MFHHYLLYFLVLGTNNLQMQCYSIYVCIFTLENMYAPFSSPVVGILSTPSIGSSKDGYSSYDHSFTSINNISISYSYQTFLLL